MPYVEALLPTIVVGLIFWYVIKAITNADRKERTAEAAADAKNNGPVPLQSAADDKSENPDN
ncbi:hypothetical protein [Glutamicibacter sp. PS]|uniref:hypothetical protein n=1 Tax=Glutamicibacter sp. PS TaxID=3075634 RepID=UPI00283B2CD3|nr:hypothetical protein [Glutamicibacter sp. PS]MDR4534813.1 hypothetical protein [Glutamicibacter sp. PS]